MAGGKFDSSLTRVAPIFTELMRRDDQWLRALVALPEFGSPTVEVPDELDLKVQQGFWGTNEKALDPPVGLLSWLIRHAPQQLDADPDERRLRLHSGDPETVAQALRQLRSGYAPRDWYIFEGPTVPDAFLVTKDALVVVEGKRTEAGPTTHTKWMPHRHQMWRHIDAAWEIRGHRAVYGFFAVEGIGTDVPDGWRKAAAETLSVQALEGSFPHRSASEVAEISKCFLGVTTWSRICAEFKLPPHCMRDETGE